jgi:hypothetical protein
MITALGPVAIDLPAGWSQELDVVLRGPTTDGHAPQIRLTIRTSDRHESPAAIAAAYAERLEASVPGRVVQDMSSPLTAPGAEGVEARYSIVLEDGPKVQHRVVVLVAGKTVITAGASTRDDVDGAVRAAIAKALGSLKVLRS